MAADRGGGVLVAAKTSVASQDSTGDVALIIDDAEPSIRAAEPMVTALHLEPDMYRPDYVAEARREAPARPVTEHGSGTVAAHP